MKEKPNPNQERTKQMKLSITKNASYQNDGRTYFHKITLFRVEALRPNSLIIETKHYPSYCENVRGARKWGFDLSFPSWCPCKDSDAHVGFDVQTSKDNGFSFNIIFGKYLFGWSYSDYKNRAVLTKFGFRYVDYFATGCGG